MLTLLLFSFLAGLITILAPCIWPLLPIVFSASSSGGKLKPLGMTIGVMVSFTVFTLFISYVIKVLPVNPNTLRLAATAIIALMGLFLLVPSLGAGFEVWINRLLGPAQSKFKAEGHGLGAGLLTGFSLGLVWAPCAGPILAAIAALSATQSVHGRVIAVTVAYVLGLGVPLYVFSFLTAKFFAKMRTVNKHTGLIQQAFGLIMIAAAVLVYTNEAQIIQAKVLDLFPGYGRFLGQFENNSRVQKELDHWTGHHGQQGALAPDFPPEDNWLNTAPLSMQQLRGKVVLVDFWTYSCINCLRTLPHVTAWYDRYRQDGFVVIGVHTPEFAFEKETQNVERAIRQFGIHYPVVQDNDYKIWNSYRNRFWPAEYLTGPQGHIRRTHFGEGHYREMEEAIRGLLQENGRAVQGPLSPVLDQTPHLIRTPETYLGSRRMPRRGSPVTYQGPWNIQPEYAQSVPGAVLLLNFHASKVFMVAGPAKAGERVKVSMDGKFLQEVVLDGERLYNIADLKGQAGSHTLRFEFLNAGTKVYTFTFG